MLLFMLWMVLDSNMVNYVLDNESVRKDSQSYRNVGLFVSICPQNNQPLYELEVIHQPLRQTW